MRRQLVSFDKVVKFVALTVAFSFVAAYFIKPKQPLLELVSPQQELAEFRPSFPGDTRLADRIVKSYALAIVLEQSPYLQKNINSLESIRGWAHDQFQKRADFLHPSTIASIPDGRDTVFGALAYHLFTGVHYALQAACGDLLSRQIANWHQTSSYRSFNSAYFDFFGADSEAAILLARYQTERAKQAIDIVLWSAVWIFGGLVSIALLARSRRFFSTLQKLTAAAWGLLTCIYVSQAWTNGLAQDLLAALLSLTVCLYLCAPVAFLQSRSGQRRFVRVELATRWVALAAWFTVSCAAIQILTWIKTGIPTAPDPITLLLSSITGNFIHDPAHGKRWVALTTAALWLLASAWTLWQQYRLEPLPAQLDLDSDDVAKSLPFESSVN